MDSGTLAVYALFCAAAFLLASVPFGFLVGKARGIDIRRHGSGNIGATNVYRVVGKPWGLLAFACDFLKGLVPVLAAKRFFPELPFLPVAAGVAAVFGHMYTVFMRFKGGKGVATGFGMLVALSPVLVLCAFGIFVALVAAFRYISLGSVCAAAFLAVAVWIPCAALGNPEGWRNWPTCAAVAAVCLFSVWKHRSNIARLLSGTESKIF